MVRVHETGRHETPARVDHPCCRRRRGAVVTNADDHAVVDGDPAAGQLAALIVHRGDQLGARDEQVDGIADFTHQFRSFDLLR